MAPWHPPQNQRQWNVLFNLVANLEQEAQLPLRNRASAIHFPAAVKLLWLTAACTFYDSRLKLTATWGGGYRGSRPTWCSCLTNIVRGNISEAITILCGEILNYVVSTGRSQSHVSHPADKCSWFYWTVKLSSTWADLNPSNIQIGILFSSWRIVRSSKTSTIWNKSWTVAGWRSTKN